MAEELHEEIVRHQETYVDFKERGILDYYTKELKDTEKYITESLRDSQIDFVFGGEAGAAVCHTKNY